MSAREVATLAGGCFWCLEAVYQEVDGVESIVSGYMGGITSRPTYQEVCGGISGHAEVVQLEFDPARVSFRELLEIFFVIHDPTTRDRQGNDVGTQYRSAIFYHSPDQKRTAEMVIAQITAEAVYSGPIVTEVTEAVEFWPAESYHQNYFREHPYQPYCLFVVSPKVKKYREKFRKK